MGENANTASAIVDELVTKVSEEKANTAAAITDDELVDVLSTEETVRSGSYERIPYFSSTKVEDGRSGRRSTMYKIDCQHCHHNVPANTQDRNRIISASILCFIFMVAELIGGILSNSLAITTDAAHLLSDFSAFLVSLFAMWIASKPATPQMNFGYYRAEVLGALLSILIIWFLTGVLVYMAIERVVKQNFIIDVKIMLFIALVGIFVNMLMGSVLHCSCGLSPSDNLNVKAAFIHVIGDLLQSFAVLIAAIVIYVKPSYKLADPICTFIFCFLILCTTIKILRAIINILMEGVPRGMDLALIQNLLLELPGVCKIYNLRVWALTMEHIALSAHLAIQEDADALLVLKQATDIINQNFNLFEMTLQIEEYNSLSTQCSVCDEEEENGGDVEI